MNHFLCCNGMYSKPATLLKSLIKSQITPHLKIMTKTLFLGLNKTSVNRINKVNTKHISKIQKQNKNELQITTKFRKIFDKIMKEIVKKGESNTDDKKRRICENPATELITALVMCDNSLTLQEIENMKFCEIPENLKVPEDEFEKYMKDLNDRLLLKERKNLDAYTEKFKSELENTDFIAHLIYVIICGKKNKFDEVDEANSNLSGNDSKDAKSDIMVIVDNGSPIGLSVKASGMATKSNYSVVKFFPEDAQKECKQVKTNYLTENGFPIFKKEDRPQHNALFYERSNPFFDILSKHVEVNKEQIGISLVDSLYGSKLNYDLYEFDGSSLTKLSKKVDYSSIEFKEHPEFYLTKDGKKRECAKMFYKLSYDNKDYRVEIRWKGNIHTAFPQFQIHDM